MASMPRPERVLRALDEWGPLTRDEFGRRAGQADGECYFDIGEVLRELEMGGYIERPDGPYGRFRLVDPPKPLTDDVCGCDPAPITFFLCPSCGRKPPPPD